MRRTLILFLVPLAAIAGGAAWYFTAAAGPSGPVAGMMALCATVPTHDAADRKMAELGWTALPAEQSASLQDMTALFHTALRRSSSDLAFDPVKERENFISRHTDAIETLSHAETRAYGRDDSIAMAVIAPIDGVPNAVGCDVFLPADADDDWFSAMIDPMQKSGNSRAWASGLQTVGRGPRPGVWAANLVRIEPDPELTAFMGYAPAYGLLSRNSFRGPLNQ